MVPTTRVHLGGVLIAVFLAVATLGGCSVPSSWDGAALDRADEAARLAVVDCSCTAADVVPHLDPYLGPDDRRLGYRGGPADDDTATTDLELHVRGAAGWGGREAEGVRCVRVTFRTTDLAPVSPEPRTSIVDCPA